MATNMVHTPGNQLEVVAAAAVVSGAPMAVGQLPGVALTDSEAVTLRVTMKTDGVFNIPVTAGVAAIAPGAIVYLNTTGTLDTVNTGVRFGYALGAVLAAATTTIKVKVGY